jgi:hypothetical protein
MRGSMTFELAGNPFWDALCRQLNRRPLRDIDPNIPLDYRLIEPAPGLPEGLTLREYFMQRYCHTIPDPFTLRFLQETLAILYFTGGVTRMVSSGAGKAYLEALMSTNSFLDVLAFDPYPPGQTANEYHDGLKLLHGFEFANTWHPVITGTPDMIDCGPETILFQGWPPPGPAGYDSLSAFRGNWFLYNGALNEPEQNGSAEFFALLEAEWREVERRQPLRWIGSRDLIVIYARRHPR